MSAMSEAPTTRVTEPLRAEHRELLPHVEQLRALGDAADGASGEWLPLLDDALARVASRYLGDPEAAKAAAESEPSGAKLGPPAAPAATSPQPPGCQASTP